MESVKLKNLFDNVSHLTWKGSKETSISSITANSKTVCPGALFVAKRGKTGDGHRFIAEALANGAAALLTDTYDPFLSIPQVIHPDVNRLESLLATRFYKNPAAELTLIGITGTSGKTTTAYLIQHLLKTCGLIGTIVWMTGKKVLPATLSTPDLLTVMQLLHDMVASSCTHAVMEVSSHALDQGRLEGIPFNIGLLTNLSHDHLDYHVTLENYAAAKAKLFTALSPDGLAIVNADDLWTPTIIQHCKAPLLTYGLHAADLQATQIKLSSSGMEFSVAYKGEKVQFSTSLIGRFNIYNILAATAVSLSQNQTLSTIAASLRHFPGVPGRLERVPNRHNAQVFVDYAHKPEALRSVLTTLQELKTARLITVFGCGGQRDTAKRPQMGAIAEELSDLTIVTSDNPRTEDPVHIASQITQGFKSRSSYLVELDRRKAIAIALAMAKPGDIVLIAGKGHETYQIFADRTIAFDDRAVVREV
jgi:UDP-N-acetylmuramoyl-L-alanyl-D-glutamate--2,6-diaminopimelate ligase